MRMGSFRLPKSVFYSELSSNKRHPERQHLRYKDVLKRNLTAIAVLWEELAVNKTEWGQIVHKHIENYEQSRL